MSKRTIIIITVVLILLAGGAYWYTSNKPVSLTPTPEFPGGSGTIPGFTDTTPGQTPEGDITPFVPGSTSALPRLYELHKAPVAGAGFAETKDKKGTVTNIVALYIERGLGHIYETQLSTYAESRIVNETRSRLSEALWGNNGKSVVVRFVDDKEGGVIKSHIVNIGAPTISFARGTSTENISSGFLKTEETSLPGYIPFMAVSEDGADKLFYLEGGVGSTATFRDTSVTKVFSSAFTEWLPQFPNQNLVTLNTRPSASIPGHLFFLDLKTKAVTKVLGGINGLTTLTSHDGKFVLLSETKGGIPELSTYDIAKKEFHSLYIQSLPEKCVWSNKKLNTVYCAVPQTLPNATYPDQWYQGLVSFSDDLWEIDAKTGNTKRILTLRNLDMTNLSLSSDDSHLLFMNKISGTPWVYSLVEPSQPRTVITPPFSTTTAPITPSPVSTTPTSPKLPNAGNGPGMVKIK